MMSLVFDTQPVAAGFVFYSVFPYPYLLCL